MGMGRKPFMDIRPSDAAICDRAISCVRPGRSKELHTSYYKLAFNKLSKTKVSQKIFYFSGSKKKERDSVNVYLKEIEYRYRKGLNQQDLT